MLPQYSQNKGTSIFFLLFVLNAVLAYNYISNQSDVLV